MSDLRKWKCKECGHIDCWSTIYDTPSCPKCGEGGLEELTEAPRPTDSSGSTGFVGCMAKDLKERVLNGDIFTHVRTGKNYVLYTDVLGTRLEER